MCKKLLIDNCTLFISCFNSTFGNMLKLYNDALLKWFSFSTAHKILSVYIEAKLSTSPLFIENLVHLIKKQNLVNNCEFSLSFTPNKYFSLPTLAILKSFGINRICLRPIHLTPAFIKEDTKTFFYIEEISQVFENVCVDVTYNCNNPIKEEDYCSAFYKLADVGVKHITIQELKVNHNSCKESFYQTKNCVDDDFFAYNWIRNALTKFGYNQYDLCNFAVDGHKCKQNMYLWSGYQFFGIGPNAHSRLCKNVNQPFDRLAVTCSHQNSSFLFNSKSLSAIEVLEELLFLGLRSSAGVDNLIWKLASNGKSLSDIFYDDKNVQMLISNKILCFDKNYLKINADKILLLDAVLVILLQVLSENFS